jgi:TRAP-type transport system periplasmic protein
MKTLSALWMAFLILFGAGPALGKTVIKVALITPEGSAWTQVLTKMTDEVSQKTKGEVDFKIYPGGVSGDELDVIRKMKAGLIHAAGFSGVGLGVLLPQIRILEAPLLYKTYAEIDLVKEKLYDEFAADLEKCGYILLGFAEAGFVYIFSKTDVSGPDWVSKSKMWAWKGDPVAETFLKNMGINTFPLPLTDVNTGLETGMIDSFYCPPLAAMAFQWHSKIRYMLDYPVVNSTGALVMKKDIFEKLSPENRAILIAEAKKYCAELIQTTRRDNAEAISLMQAAGITLVQPSVEQIKSFEINAKKSYQENIPKIYSEELLGRVEQIVGH